MIRPYCLPGSCRESALYLSFVREAAFHSTSASYLKRIDTQFDRPNKKMLTGLGFSNIKASSYTALQQFLHEKVCSDEGLTLETSAKRHIPQATNIPYQPLLIKPIFSVLAHAERQIFFRTSLAET